MYYISLFWKTCTFWKQVQTAENSFVSSNKILVFQSLSVNLSQSPFMALYCGHERPNQVDCSTSDLACETVSHWLSRWRTHTNSPPAIQLDLTWNALTCQSISSMASLNQLESQQCTMTQSPWILMLFLFLYPVYFYCLQDKIFLPHSSLNTLFQNS